MPEKEHFCRIFPCHFCHDDDSGPSPSLHRHILGTRIPRSKAELLCEDTSKTRLSTRYAHHPSKDQGCSGTTTFEREESSPANLKGFNHRSEGRRWVAEIRPSRPEWAKGGPGRPAEAKGDLKIALGSYRTEKAAAMAFDVGIYYTKKPVKYNYRCPCRFLKPFPKELSLANCAHVAAIINFVRDQAYAYVAKYENETPPSEDRLLEFLDSLSDPSPDHLDFPELKE